MSARPTRCQRQGCCNLLDQAGNRPRLWCSDTCRKRKYDRACLDCGARVCGTTPGRSKGRCFPCAMDAAKVWTPEAIVCAIQEWADRNGGIPPSATDWQRDRARQDDRVCSVVNVLRVWGRWNAAIEAAGFEPHATGPVGGYTLLTPRQRREIVRRYAAGESSVQLAAAFDCAPNSVLTHVRRSGVPVRPHAFAKAAA